MKKFLSLALALIMTLSLVTISAGATEYKDLTDKDEIKYEEAVAVLNRLGIITGYSEGDFRPEGELTRGAAAKIIVSLLIGPEAAEALPTTSSPYPDVPAGNVFAGYISFCKTEKIINGYNDGTFRPTGTLTGFAFAKMLLSALGFDGDVEGFTGSGWTMRVASLGNTAGLFDRISFKGGETVNRETACQLALNTLKATTVEYNGSGSTSITIAGVPVDIGGTQKWSYRTSNQEFARNINRDTAANSSQYYTVEFGEEHFVDLRLEHGKKDPIADDFGRPSAQWSYKRVTIGTYPLEADYSYTAQVTHNVSSVSSASKVRALGLNGYTCSKNGRTSALWLNGKESTINDVAKIADYTDNGTEVYVYISYEDGYADFISDVVVIQSQLMEVKRVGSDYVSLQMYDNDTSDDNDILGTDGYNQLAINKDVANVETGDDYYTLLSGMKAGDRVVVTPYYDGSDNKYEVGHVYVPESVSGAFTAVNNYGTASSNRHAIDVTVGGTKYTISQWHKDLGDVNGDTIKITRGDVTLTLDKYGYAMLGEHFGESSEWMIIGAFRKNIENGRLVTLVEGWEIDGDPVELNLGPAFSGDGTTFKPGDLVKYTSETNSNLTDWSISRTDVFNVWTGTDKATTAAYEIKASNTRVALENYPTATVPASYFSEYVDNGVKFIYVNFNDDGEVESVEVKTGVQNVDNDELKYFGSSNYAAEACVKNVGKTNPAIKAVVIKQESNEISGNILYIRDYITGAQKTDSNGRIVYGYTVAVKSADGSFTDETTIYSYDNLRQGDFASFAEREVEGFSPFYDLRKPSIDYGRTATVILADLFAIVNADKGYIGLSNYHNSKRPNTEFADVTKVWPEVASYHANLGSGDEVAHLVRLRNAKWVDMTGENIDNMSDLKEWVAENYVAGSVRANNRYLEIRLLVNDNPSNDGFRDVAVIVIENIKNGTPAPQPNVAESGKGNVNGFNADGILSLTFNGKPVTKDTVVSVGDSLSLSLKDGFKATTSGTQPSEVSGTSETTLTVTSTPVTITVTEDGSSEPKGEPVTLTGLDKMAVDAEATAVVYDDAIIPTLTFTAPEWAAPSSTDFAATDVVNFKYTYQIGNKAPTTGAKTLAAANISDGTYSLVLEQINLPEGTTVKDVKINATIKQWKEVKVEYTVDGQPVAVNTNAIGTKATATLTTTNTGAFNAKLPSNFNGTNVAWEITGATRANSASLKGTAATITSGTGFELVNTSNPVTALGTGPVVVKFGAMTEAPITNWVISADSTSTGVMDVATAITNGTFIATAPVGADATFLVKVVVDGTAAAAGETVDVSKTATKLNLDLTVGETRAFALGNIGSDPVSAYNVHIALLNGETEVYSRDVKVDGKGDNVDRSAGLDMSKVSSDLTLKLTVTPVLSNKIDSGVVNKDTGVVSIQFKEPVLANQVTISKFAAVNASISKVEIIPYTARETADTAYAIGAYVTLSNINESVSTVSIKIVGDIESKDGSILDKTTAFNVTVNNGNITGTGEAGAPVTPADPDAPAGPGGAASQSVNAVPSVVGSVSGITIKSYKSGDNSKTQITTADKFAEGDKIVVEVVVAGTVKNGGSNGDSAFANAATLTFDSGWSVTTAAATGFTVASGVVTFTEKNAAAALVSSETTFTAEYTVTKANAEAQAAFDLPAITFAAANSN